MFVDQQVQSKSSDKKVKAIFESRKKSKIPHCLVLNLSKCLKVSTMTGRRKNNKIKKN